jgi:hypothetical protein
MERRHGHSSNLGRIALQRNASSGISMVVLPAKIGNKRPMEHDPDQKGRVAQSGNRFSETIMLKLDEIMTRFDRIMIWTTSIAISTGPESRP